MSFAIDTLRAMEMTCARMRDRIKDLAYSPETEKVLDLNIGPSMAAALVGRTPEALAKAESQGRLPAPKTLPNGRRTYSVSDLETIRQKLGITAGRKAGQSPITLAVQNFKGGVAKSTVTVHCAHYLGLRGYRVLVVDMDPQASTTTMFGWQPEALLDDVNVLGNFLSPRSAIEEFAPCIRKTSWPTIDLVPCNIGLQDAEWDLTSTVSEGIEQIAAALSQLRLGLAQVEDNYDVVIIDPPPALGFLGLNSLAAANALIIPVPARQLDYLSTIHFLGTIAENLETLEKAGIDVEFAFIKVLCTMYKGGAETGTFNMMKASYGGQMVSEPLLHSEEIKNANMLFQSIYELSRPAGSYQAYKRCLANLDQVFGEIERYIRDAWESQSAENNVGEAA